MHLFHHRARLCRGRNAGFSLVEIMIVVVVISLLALLALPAFTKVRRAAQSRRFASDLRTFSQAYEVYVTANGTFPPAAASGIVPAGMSSDLQITAWTGRNSLGGQWAWENGGPGLTGIVTTGGTAPLSQMVEIDEKIDDGDLTHGLFQQSGAGSFIYLIPQ